MVKGYLEDQITNSLERYWIIENNRTPVVYRPEDCSYGYKRFRQSFLKNLPAIGITGIGITAVGTAGVVFYNPELARNLATGIGVASGVGVAYKILKPFDRWMQGDAEDIAQKYFLGVDVPWREAYESLVIESKKDLDGYVHLAQISNKIGEQKNHDTQLALGIGIAKTADFLSDLSFDSKLSGFSLGDAIEMLFRQKVGSERESREIMELHRKYSTGKLGRMVNRVRRGKLDPSSVPGLEVLYDHLNNYEYVLRTSSGGLLEGVGSQISRGVLMLTNDTGPETGSYAGMYSKGTDCPRIKVKDDVDHSFGTHASRLFAVIGGNVGQGALEESTGAVLIVEGTAEHHFCHKADDSTWPLVGITVGGLTQRLDEIKNGLIISLAQDKLLRNSGEKPCAYRFRNGVREKIELPMGENDERMHEAPESLEAINIVRDYISEWDNREKNKLIKQLDS